MSSNSNVKVEFISRGEYRDHLEDNHLLVGISKGKEVICKVANETDQSVLYELYKLLGLSASKLKRLREGKTLTVKRFLRIYPVDTKRYPDNVEYYVGIKSIPPIIPILFGVGVGALILILFLMLKQPPAGVVENPSATSSKPGFSTEIDPGAEQGGWESKTPEEIQAELNQKVEAGMINISMNLNPVFENGTSEGNLMIVNEEINNYPQVIEIFLKDTYEKIYTSGMIPVGSKIDSARLDVDLAAGQYECIAEFNSVDPETGDAMGKAAAEITIIIKE